MKLKSVYIWFVCISILLLTLIAVQVYWLKKNAGMQQQETDNRIGKALEKVKTDLETNINCAEGYSKTFVDSGDDLFIIRQHRISGNKDKETDTIALVFDPTQFGLKADTLIKHKYWEYPYPSSLEMKLDFHFPFTAKEKQRLKENGSLDFKTHKTFREILASKTGITSLLNMHYTDSLLREYLRNEHINTAKFGFAFLQESDHHITFRNNITDSAALLKSPNFINLFSDNKFMEPYRLIVLIPSKYESYSFDGILLVSIGIILLLSAGFYFFARLYIRQSQLSEMKADFINNLTHEFNTPLANIGLAVETLGENQALNQSKLERVINIISAESFRLRENIERILQVASLEKGSLHMHKEIVDLVPLLTTVVSGYQLQCEELVGGITWQYPDHALVKADEVHILNCICNLLDNAIKYRQRIPIIEIKLSELSGKIYLSVTDNGIGMSHETQQHIFEKFYRSHQGNIHNTKGFGLGLNYVKGIIEAHSGKITVQSKPGMGSTFTIQLPAVENDTK